MCSFVFAAKSQANLKNAKHSSFLCRIAFSKMSRPVLGVHREIAPMVLRYTTYDFCAYIVESLIQSTSACYLIWSY